MHTLRSESDEPRTLDTAHARLRHRRASHLPGLGDEPGAPPPAEPARQPALARLHASGAGGRGLSPAARLDCASAPDRSAGQRALHAQLPLCAGEPALDHAGRLQRLRTRAAADAGVRAAPRRAGPAEGADGAARRRRRTVKLSVVTPSYNQAAFIERTIRSVLDQEGDFELEYLVVDGGSTDGTLEILERYRGRLAWISGPDAGQVDAIGKGFARTTGEVLAWLNSDDVYLPGALDAVARALREPGARWGFGQCRVVAETDREIRHALSWYKNRLSRRYSLRRLLTKDLIPQAATLFPRDLLAQAGPVEPAYHYA